MTTMQELWEKYCQKPSPREGYEISDTFRHLFKDGKLEPAKKWEKKGPIE